MYAIQDVNKAARTNEIGIFIKKGGLLTADVPLTFLFKFIRVRTAGDVTIIDENGNTFLLIDCQPGEYHPIIAKGYASSGTTATGIYYYGGV